MSISFCKLIGYFARNPLNFTILIIFLFFSIINLMLFKSSPYFLSNLFFSLLFFPVCYCFLFFFLKKYNKVLAFFLFFFILIILGIGAKFYEIKLLEHFNLGCGHLIAKEYDSARNEFEECLKHPGYFDKNILCNIHFKLIRIYLNRQNWDKANYECFKLWRLDRENKIIRIDETDEGNLYYAFCYDKKNLLNDARERYLKVLNEFSDNTEVLFRLAQICFTQNEYSNAIYFVKKSVELSPNNPAYHELLGVLYFRVSQFELAEKEYSQALALEPGNKVHIARLCSLYLYFYPDNQKAIVFAERFCREFPLDPDGHELLARAYSQRLRYSEAIKEYKKAISLSRKDENLKNELKKLIDSSYKKNIGGLDKLP